MGERVCGGRRPGATSAGWPGTSEKPTPRLCRKTPVVGSTRCEPKSSALDCVSDTPRPSASCAHRCVVSPSPRRATSRGRPVPRRPAPRRVAPRGCASTRAAAAARRSGSRSASPSAPSKSTAGRSWPTARQRLDEQVGPLRVVRVGPEAGRLGHRGAGQREVALRRGRHGPQLVAPRAGAQRRAPRRRAGGEVGRREVAAAELEQAPAELPLVEAVAAVAGDGAAACGRCRAGARSGRCRAARRGTARRRRGGRARDGWPAPA